MRQERKVELGREKKTIGENKLKQCSAAGENKGEFFFLKGD